MDADVAEIASRQHGLIRRDQALAAGVTRRAIDGRTTTGRWKIVRPSVYAIAGSLETWEQTVMAVVLAAGDSAAASHATAARLWGLPCPRLDGVEITTIRERHVRLAGVRAHRSRIIPEADRTVLSGIAVTSGARTAVDLSGRLEPGALRRLVDDGLRRGVLTLSGLNRCVSNLERLAPGRSPERVRQLLAKRIPGYEPGDSHLETRIYDWIVDAGLPAPIRLHEVHAGGRTYRIDLAYPEQRIAIEVDGYDFHRERRVFDIDRSRGNALVADGWRLFRFTSSTKRSEVLDVMTPLVRPTTHTGVGRTNKRRIA